MYQERFPQVPLIWVDYGGKENSAKGHKMRGSAHAYLGSKASNRGACRAIRSIPVIPLCYNCTILSLSSLIFLTFFGGTLSDLL